MAKADFTIAEFLAFARSKPSDERYCYADSDVCAFAQFGVFTGRPELVGPSGTKIMRTVPLLWEAINPGSKFIHLGCSVSHTFGALVKRLEALLPAKSDWLSPQTYLDCGEYVA